MTNENLDNVMLAIADPTRRVIIDRLRTGPSAVGKLAEGLKVTRPAVSQHLKVLCDAGLLDVEQKGTRRIYRLVPQGFESLRAYLDQLWDDALRGFADRAEQISKGI